MYGCQLYHIYPFHPEYLQAWALVALTCGIMLLVEALVVPALYFALRRRMIPRWQLAFTLAPLAGGVGASRAWASGVCECGGANAAPSLIVRFQRLAAP